MSSDSSVKKNIKTTCRWTSIVHFLLIGYLIFSGCSREEKKEISTNKTTSNEQVSSWSFVDSAPYNLTTLDPVSMVDAFSINVLANVYEGLVSTDPEGRIIPALSHDWQVSSDGKVWTFHLRTNVLFHPPPEQIDAKVFARAVTARDVVYSLNRAVFSKKSLYGWLLSGLLADRGQIDFERGQRHPDLKALDEHTVEVTLQRPFPLLNRLVTVGGWIYPENIDEGNQQGSLSRFTVGTGAYRLKSFIPDDRIELICSGNFGNNIPSKAPTEIIIRIFHDSFAALQAFKAGRVDGVELDLGTLAEAGRLEAQREGVIHRVTANYLDYIVIKNARAPFDDIRVRKALNLAIDRKELSNLFSGLALPAYGFIPPVSQAYRGETNMEQIGFSYAPEQARRLLDEYLKEKGLPELPIELTMDAGEFPEAIGQYVQGAWRKNLPSLKVSLKRITWPEVLQQAFSGNGICYRFWWNIVTPSEDLYFLFYFPGQNPPKGFNLSFFNDSKFERMYYDIFSILKNKERIKRVGELEDMLIADAAAVPLLHRKYAFLIRTNVNVPINGLLRKYYALSERLTPLSTK